MAVHERRVFAALLDELLAEDVSRESAGNPPSLDYLSVADELHSGRIQFSDRQMRAEYHAQQETAWSETPAEAADEPPSTDPDEIARELGLAKRFQMKNLDRLRRDFAFSNHPDRVPAHLRANAMIRMQVANRLIDEAKRDRFKRVRFRKPRA